MSDTGEPHNRGHDDDERHVLRVIESTFPLLSAWQERGRTVYRPESKSDLFIDDEDWPPMPVSQVAWMGLAVVADNLTGIRRHIETRQLFPFSHLALCRGALLGAAQAVWVLAPNDRNHRIRRARTVVEYLYRYQGKYLDGLRELAAEPHANTDQAAELVSQRHEELSQKRQADGELSKLNATDMIETAAAEAFADDALTKNATLAWQAGSGVAHGMIWPLYGTPAMRQSDLVDENGLADFQIGGTLSVIANPYCAAFELA